MNAIIPFSAPHLERGQVYQFAGQPHTVLSVTEDDGQFDYVLVLEVDGVVRRQTVMLATEFFSQRPELLN